MKKWNSLLQENLGNAHKIEELREQLMRQKQTYEHQLSLAHNKIIQMNSALPAVFPLFVFTPDRLWPRRTRRPQPSSSSSRCGFSVRFVLCSLC